VSSSAAPPRASGSPAGVFVTGTGTEIGKTVVAAVIARDAARRGLDVAVFKPAVSGLDDCEGKDAVPDHELLRAAAGSAQSGDEIAPYRYGPPVSPHLGAELAGEPIDPAALRRAARGAAEHGEYLVCEGVGGFLVPLTLGYLVRDFARDLGLPVVIAATPVLGTINHTLLTVEAVRAVGLDPAAVVLTPWPDEPGDVERSNRVAIERLAGVRVLELPWLDLSQPDSWPALQI
jgi:dethiobiotin synthetase